MWFLKLIIFFWIHKNFEHSQNKSKVIWNNGYSTVYPKKYAHSFCFAVLCCGYTLTDFPISIRLTSLALWQSNDCPSASKATLMNMDRCCMWIHYEWLHNHNKATHNKTVCIFLGIYCIWAICVQRCKKNHYYWCSWWSTALYIWYIYFVYLREICITTSPSRPVNFGQ